MKVRIKKLDSLAIIPEYSREGDAGMDLVALSRNTLGELVEYGTGLSVEIPEGYVGLVFPRSSIYKYELSLCNSVGVIDSGYRGEIICKFRRADIYTPIYDVGDRIAQLVILPYPKIEFDVVEELSETERGEGGFGSTND